MKLKDLIEALAAEIDTIRPELEEQLDELSTLSLDDPGFADQLDAYSMQMQLMGEAAGFAGFAGLEAVSVHMLNNIMLLPTQPPEEREDLVNFLRSWPSLMVHYLHNLDDPSTAAGLVDLLRVAPYPVDEHEAMRLMHQFGSLPGEIEGEEQAERQQRQTVATDEDVALVIPEDVDQKLMEGFFQEAPTQASYNLELIQNLTTEEGDISDIVAAKRSVHSLKGSSAIIGLKGITALSHHFEDILEHFESKEGDVSKDVAEILLDGAYCLEQMVGYVCGTDDYPDQSKVVLQKILDLAQSIDAKGDTSESADEGQIHHVSTEMVQALVEEVETIQPELAEQLDQLAELSVEDESFLEAMEGYTIQVQNMGEAAGYAGFQGLQSASMHIANNAMLLTTAAGDERKTLLSFLQGWPDWIIHYLKNLDDPSVAAGLVDTLRVAPYPVDEHEALRMMHQFGGLSESGEASPVLEFATEAAPASTPEIKAVMITAEDVALDVPEDVNAKLMEGFLQEGPEQAGYLLKLIRNLASEDGDISDITAAKRSAHSLKGSSATIGLRGIALLSHRFEDILEHFESNEGQVSPQVVDTLVDGAYCLEQMVGYVAGTDDYPEQSQAILQTIVDLAAKIDSGEAIVELVDRDNLDDDKASDADVISVVDDVESSTDEPEFTALNGTSPVVSVAAAPAKSAASKADTAKTTAAPEQTAKPAARQTAAAAPKAALRVGMDSIEELFRVSAEVSVHSGALEAKTKLLRDYSRDLLSQNIRLKQRLFELETLVDVRAVPLMKPAAREGMQAAFDPLEMDQYNELHSTVHALVEEVNDTIAYSQNIEEEIAQLTGMNSRQQILAGDLQHLVTGTRMAEVGTLESRLQRNIRTTAQATNKSAQLVLKGADTLIDTDVLNRLAEPLLHLLRNAVDHGIESPEVRQSLGKPAEGTVTLDFLRQGQQVVLRCSDDGKGLDPAAILSRAKSRGLVSDDAVLSDEDIIRLILTPGFSTRDEVSEVSGRGVGMDVVSEWVQNMNGTIDVRSELGVGSVIELRFAASLTTAHSLIVSIENYYFALPSVQVAQGVSRGDGEFMIENNELLYKLNDDVMPARFLSTLVGLSTEDDKSLENYDAVIVNVLNQRYALAVDELVDSRQLLVKTQNRYLQHVRGMAGTSILGDGGIAVHLDMPQLLGVREATSAPKVSSSAASTPKAVSNVPRVLIVDDSLSVRNTLQELVSDLGLQTQTARDGLEAVSAIDAFNPTLVLTDLEMPNMNGVELTTHIRGRQDIGKVPIIMITSRSLDKHRKLATEAGVDAYVTKPYNEAALIKMINETIGA